MRKKDSELLKKLEVIADAILSASNLKFSTDENTVIDEETELRFPLTYMGFRRSLNSEEWQKLATVRIANEEGVLINYCLYYSEQDSHKSAWFIQ